MAEREGGSVELERLFGGEDDGGDGSGGRGRKFGFVGGDLLRGAERGAAVFVGDDGGAGGVHPLVAVGMVEVPVGVDEVGDGIGADGGEGFGELGRAVA